MVGWMPAGPARGGTTTHPVAEAARAFLATAAFFVVAGALNPVRGQLVLILALGAVYVYIVVRVAERHGPAYGVPFAIAGALAFDAFYIPPTREFGADNWQNWLVVFIYITMGVVVGMLAARFRQRAEVSEQSRDALLAEQAALRRVATLVANGEPPGVLFPAVAREAGELLAVDGARIVCFVGDDEVAALEEWTETGNSPFPAGSRKLEETWLAAAVHRTGRAVRLDDAITTLPSWLRDAGLRAGAAAPIVVEGRLWGAMVAWSTKPGPVPDSAEARLAAFTEIVATAISNSTSREDLARLADEQAALKRVATLVARGVAAPEVFTAIARELGLLLGLGSTHMARYEPDRTVIGVGSWSIDGRHAPVGSREPLDDTGVMGMVFTSGRTARVDNYGDDISERTLAMAWELGIRSSVGAPIVVDGRLWGVMVVSTTEDKPLPPDTESRIAGFTELAATAISNTEARTQVERLLDEQEALRRVATLVARAVPEGEIFGAVTEEVGRLLGTDLAGMIRYDGEHTVTPVAAWSAAGQHPPLPERWPAEEGDAAALIAQTRRPTRVDDWNDVRGPIAAFVRDVGIQSSVANPILVEGRLWGALAVHTNKPEPLPPDAEGRLENFTELVATAIANAGARTEAARLSHEQAALRRVATLVARESPPQDVFAAVAEEVAGLLGLDDTALLRYEDDGTATRVGGWSQGDRDLFGAAERLILDGDNIAGIVQRTAAPARIDDYGRASGKIGALARKAGMHAAVGCPIVVSGRLWGCLVAATERNEPLPPDGESRMGQFTDLVATSIANVQARSELAASRARIVAATDDERRRVVRDLHDGAQQRLVHTVVTLKLAQRALEAKEESGLTLVREALSQAETGMVELRELAHGILPAVLNRGGLRAGVEALAARMPVPVEIGVTSARFAAPVEATAYFVVAEALTNVAKHARAAHARVVTDVEDDSLRIEIIDDGNGSADPNGQGLLGLADRVASRDGELEVVSAPGTGTKVIATVPLGLQRTSVRPDR